MFLTLERWLLSIMKIWKRSPTGSYYYTFYDGSGKAITKSAKTRNYANAWKAGVAAEEKYKEENKQQGFKSIRVDDAITLYLDTLKLSGKSRKHASSYCNRLRGRKYNPRKPEEFENVTGLDLRKYLHEVTTAEVTVLFDGYYREKASESHIKAMIVNLRKMITCARKNGNKTPDLEYPTVVVKSEKIRVLSHQEEAAIIDDLMCNSQNPRAVHYFICLLHTGQRAQGCSSMKWKDVSFEDNSILIYHGKGGKPVKLSMSARLRESMEWLDRNKTNPYVHVGNDLETHRSYSSKFLKGSLTRLGFDTPAYIKDNDGKITLHTTRHTFITRMISGGMPIYDAGKLAGHRSTKTTELYAHYAPSGDMVGTLLDALMAASNKGFEQVKDLQNMD